MPEVIDGGFAWDNTIAGMTIYANDGMQVAQISPVAILRMNTARGWNKEEHEALALRIAVALRLVTLAPAPNPADDLLKRLQLIAAKCQDQFDDAAAVINEILTIAAGAQP